MPVQKKDPEEKPMPNGNGTSVDLDKLFCLNARKYKLEKLWLKAIAVVESNLNPKAYRFEPLFFDRYLKNNPEWKDKDPKVVSASYGIFQIMLTTAHALGLRDESVEKIAESLYNPVINSELAAKLLRQTLDKIKDNAIDIKYQLNPFAIANAVYNGGSRGNPAEDGKLRNQIYVAKIFKEWYNLRQTEKECPED